MSKSKDDRKQEREEIYRQQAEEKPALDLYAAIIKEAKEAAQEKGRDLKMKLSVIPISSLIAAFIVSCFLAGYFSGNAAYHLGYKRFISDCLNY
jgi:hypothetical protein